MKSYFELLKQSQSRDALFTSFEHNLNLLGQKVERGKVFADFAFYDQRPVAALTNETFFEGPGAVANTNLPNADYRRPQGEHSWITALRIHNAVNADLDASDWEPGAGAAELKNARMDFVNNTNIVLRSFDLAEALENLTTRDNGVIPLNVPIMWLGQNSISVTLNFPTAPVANQNVRITLIGLGLIS